jgi:hypothetical protein
VTEDGLRIGSLFVIDQRPRENGPSESDIEFLGVMAKNTMQHLHQKREAEQRKRIMIMSKGLASFAEGKHRISSEWKIQNHADTVTSTGHERKMRPNGASSSVGEVFKSTSAIKISGADHSEMETRLQGDSLGVAGEIPTHASVLARASNLLRESLDVAFTLFLDINFVSPRSITSSNGSKSFTHDNTKHVSRPATLLGFSTCQSSFSRNDEIAGQFEIMESRMIKYLLKKYPTGHLWSFDESGHEIMVDDNDKSNYTSSESEAENKQGRTRSKEAVALLNCFPGARQVLYAPMHNLAASSSPTVCVFAVSLQEVPAFSTEVELAFLRAFLNSVAVEWDRVSVSIADRQKADFLSSISHELRSPLHGILASTELLSDFNLGASERALCDTISGCGQTC